ncbi:MAG: hypothetical protein KF729_01800 [Sandaracinaceae bacterium]|nr:hypothetical protein [Sandaracinaceae bacterium]
MKHKQHYLVPVIAGGVLSAILSAIPLVNYCNFIFCMWMLLGAGLAVYLVKQKAKTNIEPGEGAAIGGLTGLVTGGLFGALYLLLFVIFGAAMIPGAPSGQGGEAAMGAGMMILIGAGSCIGSLVIFGAFGALGGVLGAMLTKDSAPPAGGQNFGQPPGGGFGQPPQGPGGFGPPPGGGFNQPPPGGGFGPPPGGGFNQPPPGGGFGPPPGGGGYPPPGQF